MFDLWFGGCIKDVRSQGWIFFPVGLFAEGRWVVFTLQMRMSALFGTKTSDF